MGRTFAGRLVLAGLLLLSSLNLAGCLGITTALGTTGSQSSSSSSSAPPAPAPPSAVPAPAAPTPPATTPSSVSFGNVLAGVNYTQTLLISNVGSSDLTVTQVAESGSGFGVSGYSLPLTLTAGQSASLAIGFDSTASGGAAGTITIASNAAESPTTVGLSATVTPSIVQISANPTSVSFGATTIGSAASQNVTLTNTGNSTVNISSVAAGGGGFTVSGGSNVTLAPNQSVNVAVSFNPSTAGAATGNLIVTSNAPAVQIGLSGTGGAPPQHVVTLNWSPSTSVVVGYYVYRGTGANAQLAKLSGIVAATSYQDTNVVAGQTYTYAVTSVDANNIESAFSTPVSVTIPTP